MASGLYFKDTCRNKDFFNCVVVGEHSQMTIPVPVCLVTPLLVTLQMVKDPRDLFKVTANKKKGVAPLHIFNIVTKVEQDVNDVEFHDYISDIWTATESDEIDSYVLTLMNTREVLDTGIVTVSTPPEPEDILSLGTTLLPDSSKLKDLFNHPTQVFEPKRKQINGELLTSTVAKLATQDTVKIGSALNDLATFLSAIDDANDLENAKTLLHALQSIKVPKSQDEGKIKTKVTGMIHYLQGMIGNE